MLLTRTLIGTLLQTRDSIFGDEDGGRAEQNRGVGHSSPRMGDALPGSPAARMEALYGEILRSSVAQADAFLGLERKHESARQRRDRALSQREAVTRMGNLRHAEVSRRALQSRWSADQALRERSFDLRRSSEEHVMLRRIYQRLLYRIAEWRAKEEKEVRPVYCASLAVSKSPSLVARSPGRSCAPCARRRTDRCR